VKLPAGLFLRNIGQRRVERRRLGGEILAHLLPAGGTLALPWFMARGAPRDSLIKLEGVSRPDFLL